MVRSNHAAPTEEVVALLTDIAYQAVLRQGLTQPFLEVELQLWRQIRGALEDGRPVVDSSQVV